LQSVYNFGLLR